MKQTFNAKGSQTYATREAELKAHADKIDALLRTPPKPGVHFTPEGQMRKNASHQAQSVLAQKRVDITKELESIKIDMAKRHAINPLHTTQAKVKV
ncbi:MAG: hypothetical protein AAGB02_01455 [Pseudomonadota bacterium]